MTTEEYRDLGINEKNTDKAIEYLLMAAKAKDIPSAITLATLYYERKKDDKTALEWLDKGLDWFKEADEPEAFKFYAGIGYYLRGILHESNAPYLALIDFFSAFNNDFTDSLSHIGQLIYEGYDSPKAKPEVEKALKWWKIGMEKGDMESAKLYKKHKNEALPNDTKTTKTKDGNRYDGEVNEEGLPHGKGHMVYKLNGYYGEYSGEWRNGQRDGQGTFEKSNKGGGARHSYKYTGEWRDDKENGQGVSTHIDEIGIHLSMITSKYTGEFKDGEPNGHGVLLTDSYDGEFRGAPDRYEGDFENGNLNGKGTCQYANGDYYEGEFKDGNKHGRGTYTYADGHKIAGEWYHGQLVFDSLEPDPSSKTPTLMINVHTHGFDYSHYGSFLVFPKKGVVTYEDVLQIQCDYRHSPNDVLLNILDITEDSITYEVQSLYFEDNKPHTDTIRRGETKQYKDERECTATIYDEDYDYTSGYEQIIICK